MSTNLGTQGITEVDIANFLANTPGFFERHAELLGAVQLTSPHGQRAVSLQERQMEMLRDKVKGLEMKIIELIRNGQDNLTLADKLHRWTRSIMLTEDPADVPAVLVRELQHQFLIPQAGIRIWGADDAYAALPFAQPVGDDAKSFAASLSVPYCGVNAGFEAAQWLDDPASVTSLALIPVASAAGRARLRTARARLTRPDALQRRHGHRLPGPRRRHRQRRPGAPSRSGLSRRAMTR